MKKKTLKKDLAHGSHLQDSPQQILKVLKMTKMWAMQTSIFQRLRLLDGINYNQISQSLNPNKNRD